MRVCQFLLNLVLVTSFAAPARAGIVVELVPDQPGPYTGGESLTVGFWVRNEEPFDVRAALLRLDFSDTASDLLLDSAFTFDFDSFPEGGTQYQLPDFYFSELPVPWTLNTLLCLCPERFLLLPVGSPVHIGDIGVQLPMEQGLYRLDAVNADEADEMLGGNIAGRRAFTGDLGGGIIDFAVIPEPVTLSLLAIGALTVLRRRHNARFHFAPFSGHNVAIVILALLVFASLAEPARAGIVVDLVPDQPGPYPGGESLTVDVWVRSHVSVDTILAYMRLDFSASSPALGFEPAFEFDFASVPIGGVGYLHYYPDMPVPWTWNSWDCLCPWAFVVLPSEGEVRIGSLGIDLPVQVGRYTLDALNVDATDPAFGAKLSHWRASDGTIAGGAYDFAVIPEPTSLSFLIVGSLLLGYRRRDRAQRVS